MTGTGGAILLVVNNAEEFLFYSLKHKLYRHRIKYVRDPGCIYVMTRITQKVYSNAICKRC